MGGGGGGIERVKTQITLIKIFRTILHDYQVVLQ